MLLFSWIRGIKRKKSEGSGILSLCGRNSNGFLLFVRQAPLALKTLLTGKRGVFSIFSQESEHGAFH